jgi:hypothetical protein
MPLSLGPNGEFIKVDWVTNAVAQHLTTNGIEGFEVRSASKMPPISIAMMTVMTPQGPFYDVAAGRTHAEASIRALKMVLEDATCGRCKRPVLLDLTDVDTPFDKRGFHPDQEFCWFFLDSHTSTVRQSCEPTQDSGGGIVLPFAPHIDPDNKENSNDERTAMRPEGSGARPDSGESSSEHGDEHTIGDGG